MKLKFLAVITLLLTQIAGAETFNETNREVSRTFARFYLDQKEFSEAQSVLAGHLVTDVSDSSAWNFLGLTYMETADYPRASKAFRKAISLTQGKSEKRDSRGIYLYNYADSLVRMGDVDPARKILIATLQYDQIESSARKALRSLKKGEELPPLDVQLPVQTTWSGEVSLRSGYDTNVLLYSDSSLASASRSDTASPNTSLGISVGNKTGLWGGALKTKAGSSFTYQTNQAARSYNSLYNSLGLDWVEAPREPKRFTHGIGSAVDLSYLNTNGFRFFHWSGELGWKGYLQHSSRSQTEFEIPLFYQNYSTENLSTLDDDRTGFGARAKMTHSRVVGAYVLSLGAELERQSTQGSNYKSYSISAPLSAVRSLFWKMTGVASFELTRTWYPNSSENRKDTNLSFSLGFFKKFGKAWGGALDLIFLRNVSNQESAQYTKNAVSITASYDLF